MAERWLRTVLWLTYRSLAMVDTRSPRTSRRRIASWRLLRWRRAGCSHQLSIVLDGFADAGRHHLEGNVPQMMVEPGRPPGSGLPRGRAHRGWALGSPHRQGEASGTVPP